MHLPGLDQNSWTGWQLPAVAEIQMDCIVQVLLLLLLLMWRDAEVQRANICQKYIYVETMIQTEEGLIEVFVGIWRSYLVVISASGSQSFSWPEVDEGQVYVKNDRGLQTLFFLFGNPVNFKASPAFCNSGMLLTVKVRWAVEGGSAGEWHEPGGRMVVGLVDRMDAIWCWELRQVEVFVSGTFA